jgi:hypothetical protein
VLQRYFTAYVGPLAAIAVTSKERDPVQHEQSEQREYLTGEKAVSEDR